MSLSSEDKVWISRRIRRLIRGLAGGGGGSGTPGGSDTQVQFNDAGAFGGDAGLVYDKTTDTLTAGNLALTTDLPVTEGGTGASTAAGAATNLGLGTGDSPQFTAVNIGHASDTTITREEAGRIAVEGIAVPRVVSSGYTNESLTNSVNTDQDYTSVYTIPANKIVAGKVYRVTFWCEFVSGVVNSTFVEYLKLGSTKVWTRGAASELPNSLTRSMCYQYDIIGTAAAGASAGVVTAATGMLQVSNGSGFWNSTNQPVNLATNGTLDVVFGVQWATAGGQDTFTLLAYMVEELN